MTRSSAAPAATSQTMPLTARCTRWCCARPMRMRAFASPMSPKPPRCRGSRLSSAQAIPPSSATCRAKGRYRIPRSPFHLIPFWRARRCAMWDAVAFVVAETLDQARDAAEAIAIEWDVLPHVVGAAAALVPDAPLVWPPTIAPRGNLAFETELGDAEATARAFAEATRTVALTLVNQRLV